MKQNFYRPILSDWRNFETWFEDGAVDATQRAHQIYRRLLEEFKPPELDPGVLEELDEFIKVRKNQYRTMLQ